MTESEAIEKLKQHFEYLKHGWKPHPDYETMDAIGYAIQALEKQIAKKPVFNGNNWYRCVNSCEIHKKQFEKDWYCPKCGQKLDWSDEE